MALLAAFEASARRRSFTAAAAELDLTQSAVSRQIRALEELLGSDLFVRERQTVRLTSAGESYAREIRGALDAISSATLGFRANPGGGILNLAILPTFGTRWLAPRLASFTALRPDVIINLTTRLAPFDFDRDTVDAAIHYGGGAWPGARLDPLMSEEVLPACSPELRDRFRFREPADLLHAPLLHLVSRPDAWKHWFKALDIDRGAIPGMSIDQFATAAQAACAGLGVALVPTFLMQPEFDRGELVRAIEIPPLPAAGRYYLVCPDQRHDHAPLQAFRRWIVKEATGVEL